MWLQGVGGIMLPTAENSIWIYFIEEMNFLGDLGMLVAFRHVEMVNNYVQTVVISWGENVIISSLSVCNFFVKS